MRYMLSQDSSKFLTLAALDIKKAFDCVNHKLLVTKFTQKFNFTLSAASFLENYLSNRCQTMKVNGILSDRNQILTGVPQGSDLGPSLFTLENCYLFADDCLMIASGNDPSQANKSMEQSLAIASNWYNCNKLILNASRH